MNTTIKTIGSTFIGGALALGAYSFFTPKPEVIIQKQESKAIDIQPVAMSELGISNSMDFTHAASKSLNSVVHINTKTHRKQLSQEEQMFEMFYGSPGRNRSRGGSGSGVIISEDGYIVTNNHVVENTDEIKVVLNDNREYSAKIIGTDPATDMAVLKIDETQLKPIEIGNSDDVKVGEWALAVGNPFNLTSTVTAGIVSAKGRSINIMQKNSDGKNIFPIESFIQTDAAVNPGNSGGALVNSKGQLIGINTAIASKTGSYSGYSFAVPVNIMKKVTADMMKYGVVQRAFIGVEIQEMTQETADKLKSSITEGVLVTGLSKGGAAESAGIQDGDIIIKVNNAKIKKVPQLQEQIGNYNPGDKVNVTVVRGNKEQKINVTLRNQEGTTKLVEKPKVDKMLNAEFVEISAKEKKSLGLSYGVKVKNLKSGKLRNIGISKGFIITKMDKKPVKSVEELKSKLEKNNEGGILIEGVYPNGMKAYYGMGM